MERTYLCAPGSVPTFAAAVAEVERIRFFKGALESKSKLHVTLGHATVLAEVLFFGRPRGEVPRGGSAAFDLDREYEYLPALADPRRSAAGGEEGEDGARDAWALLRFERPVTCPPDSFFIGSRLDFDIHSSACRLGVHGRLRGSVDSADPRALARLKVYKTKAREGVVDRVEKDGTTAVCKGLFKRETDLSPFVGMRVRTAGGNEGTIASSFGKSGKFKVEFRAPLAPGDRTLTLEFKKYVFDPEKKAMHQPPPPPG